MTIRSPPASTISIWPAGDGDEGAAAGAAPITAGTKVIGSSANADGPPPISRRQVNSRLAFSS
jgi:hypothetical protein